MIVKSQKKINITSKSHQMIQTCHPVPSQVVSNVLAIQVMRISLRCYHLTLVFPTKIIRYVNHRNFLFVKGCLILFYHCSVHLLKKTVSERLDVFVDDPIGIDEACWGVIPIIDVNGQSVDFYPLASHFEHKVDVLGQVCIKLSVVTVRFSVIVAAWVFTYVPRPIATDEHSLRFIFAHELASKIENLVIFSKRMS